MKFLLFSASAHPENEASFERMCKKFNVEYKKTEDLLEVRREAPDLVWSPYSWIEPSQLPGLKVMYGPHFFVHPFPDHPSVSNTDTFITKTSLYNCLSEWCLNVHRDMVPHLKVPYACLPFSIDTDSLVPIQDTRHWDCMIYYKLRDPKLLTNIMAFLQKKKISYTTIVYGSYTPEEFHKRLGQSKFCVWVGRHESQGHAFQQCLSMNVPMFVVDVQSMKEELYNQEYLYANMKEKLLATAAPYFDYRCGKINRTRETLEGDFKEFQDNLVSYRPREYALEVLSDEACFRRLCIAFDLNK